MRALKIILVVMAVFIAAGFAFIGYEVFKRSTDPDHPRTFSARFGTGGAKAPNAVAPVPPVPPTPPVPPRPAASLPSQPIALPAGAVLLPGMVVVDGRLAVQMRLSDGRVQILLIDAATGENAPLVTTSP